MDEPEYQKKIKNSKHINDLPIEVLIQIFEKLHLSDLQAASLACKHWFEIIKMKIFQSKILINFTKSNNNSLEIELNDFAEPAQQFINSDRKFYNLKLKSILFEFNACPIFFNKIGETIESLELADYFIIAPNELFKILNSIKNPLKEFVIRAYIKCDTQGELINFVRQFCIYCDNPNNILSKLEKLDIYFVVVFVYDVSNTICMKLLTKNRSTLKSFKFLDEAIIKKDNFLEVWKSLKLEEIEFHRVLGTNNWSDYKEIILMQTSVKRLDLSSFKNIPIEDLDKLAKNLNCLTKLIPYFGENSQRHQLRYLLDMKNLKNYKITVDHKYSDDIRPNEILKVFGEKINNKIVELDLRKRLFTNNQLQKLILCYPNLVSLDICADGNVNSGFTGDTIQLIIRNLKLLKHLNLQGHALLTDYALTGKKDLSDTRNIGCPISQLKGLEILVLEGCKKLTDFTLINGIKFPELKTLYLGGNNKYTAEGLQVMIKNCPSLEKLYFAPTHWNHLDILQSAPRLKWFTKICHYCASEQTCLIKSNCSEQIFKPYCHNGCTT